MVEPKKQAIVKEFKPKPSELLKIIRRLAQDSKLVGFGGHSIDRMEQRGITRLDALRVLRTGQIEGDIEAGNAEGEWKCKIVSKLQGSREIGVVTIVANGRRLFVKTVEWEDLR
jgi:hypothetical protein